MHLCWWNLLSTHGLCKRVTVDLKNTDNLRLRDPRWGVCWQYVQGHSWPQSSTGAWSLSISCDCELDPTYSLWNASKSSRWNGHPALWLGKISQLQEVQDQQRGEPSWRVKPVSMLKLQWFIHAIDLNTKKNDRIVNANDIWLCHSATGSHHFTLHLEPESMYQSRLCLRTKPLHCISISTSTSTST